MEETREQAVFILWIYHKLTSTKSHLTVTQNKMQLINLTNCYGLGFTYIRMSSLDHQLIITGSTLYQCYIDQHEDNDMKKTEENIIM